MTSDWLIGGARPDAARERLLRVSSELIAARGVGDFDLDELARTAHCSRATVYRHTGGRARIVRDVLARASAAVATEILGAVDGLEGRERRVRAVEAALSALRSDRVTRRFLQSVGDGRIPVSLLDSESVLALAGECLGLEPLQDGGAGFAVRVVLAHLLWAPPGGRSANLEVARRLADALDGKEGQPTEADPVPAPN